MTQITEEIYRIAAARLREEIAAAEWFNGTIEGETTLPAGDNETTVGWRLTLTAIIYRRTEIYPEGPRRPISDVVPVWWEFATTDADGPTPNDFSFSLLKPFMTDPD
jgi:hypothetical protein